MLLTRLWFVLLLASVVSIAAAPVIHRDAWSFDRSALLVYTGTDLEKKKAEGSLSGIGGSVDYDIEVTTAGWHELWIKGATAEWQRDVMLDGETLFWLTTSEPEDASGGWLKEGNVYLSAGKHTLRLQRLMYSPVLPSRWELRPSSGSAAGSVRVVDPGTEAARYSHNAVRVGDPVKLTIEGGRPGATTTYTLVARDESGAFTDLTSVTFPGTEKPVRREVSFTLPRQGSFLVLAREAGRLLRPSDLKVGHIAALDMKLPVVTETALRVRNVLDIDCTATPPAGKFWEKDGASRVVDSPAGRYRESSGQGSVAEWGTDGFSYKFDLPEVDALYRIQVEYPDNDRRSMGFWVTDGLGSQTNFTGVVNTGGVETGDHYALSGKMLTHESYFRPRANKDLILAVLNLVPGMKSAAARIRIDLVESGLPPAPVGERGGRSLGFYFEEPGRWLRFFGGENRSAPEQLKTLERYGQWQRHIGSNLMFPTVQVYGGTHYPSRVLAGYMNTQLNETRLAALIAEKYGSQFVPELFLTGQMPFDSHVMGVRSGPGGVVEFPKPESEQIVLRDRDGKLKCFWKPFAYNPLHPRVQEVYLNIIGELADMLKDTESFAGISSRIMVGWQNQCWNSLPCLDFGYEDWTVNEFSRETGVTVPGAPGDPARFRQRFEFLTGTAMRDKWMDWRCARIFAFHQRLRDRIKEAKPSANLFFTYFPRDTPVEYSTDVLGRMREQGIDFALYEREPGMQLVPGMTYGRRFSTPLSDAEGHEAGFDPQIKAIARSGMRAAGLFGLYFEVNKNLDWTKLGAPSGLAAFDASVPAGRAELEGYATALADSDSSLIITGGNGWMFGTPALMQPFLREYRALPAKPFTRFERAVDPVAVWQHRDADGTLWFYAVNRLPVPVTAELTLTGSALKVRPAAGGGDLSLAGGRLSVALEPFMLKTYRAQSATLADVRVKTPSAYVEELRSQIDAASELSADLKARRLVPEASQADVVDAVRQIDAAVAAYGKGEYWFARSQLERTAVIRVSYASGRFIPGVWERSVPHGVPAFSDAAPAGMKVVLDGAPGALSGIRDVGHDEAGHLWVSSDEGVSEFDPAGKWMGTRTLFEPYAFENGDVRKSALYVTETLVADVISPLAGSRILVQRGTRAPKVFDTRTSRAVPLALGTAYFTNSNAGRVLSTRPDGTALISIASNPGMGVSIYAPDGTFARRVSPTPAVAGALDGNGMVYLVSTTGAAVLDPNGKEIAAIAEPGITRLVASESGGELFALTGHGRSLATWKRGADGRFVRSNAVKLPGEAISLALSPTGGATLVFRQPVDGVMVRDYKAGVARDLITTRAATPVRALTGATQVKSREGSVYFIADGKLNRFTPGTAAGDAKVVFDPKFAFESFAFGPDGDLYFSSVAQGSKRGINLHRSKRSGDGWAAPEYLNGGQPLFTDARVSTDIGVDAEGRLLVLSKSTQPPARLRGDALALFRWHPNGKASPELITELGSPQVSGGEGGLHALADGGWVVAAGNARTITRLTAEGQIVWQIRREKSATPGYPDLRCPLGITADSSGDVWVTDPTRHHIMKLDGKTGRPLQTLGSFGDGTDTTRLSLNQPTGIVAFKDRSGREWLYVADAGNRRLMAFPSGR